MIFDLKKLSRFEIFPPLFGQMPFGGIITRAKLQPIDCSHGFAYYTMIWLLKKYEENEFLEIVLTALSHGLNLFWRFLHMPPDTFEFIFFLTGLGLLLPFYVSFDPKEY